MENDLNPYRPGSGRLPLALSGREKELESFNLLIDRSKQGQYDRGIVLTGLRGVGKTVLLNTMQDYADKHDWFTISFEAQPNESGLESNRKQLGKGIRAGYRKFSIKSRAKEILSPVLAVVNNFSLSTTGITVNGNPVDPQLPAGSGEIEIDLVELVETLAPLLQKQGTVFAIFIDEMQDLDTLLLGALITAQHRAGQRNWPFYLIGAGLPNLPALLAESRTYAERLFAYKTIGALDPADTKTAIVDPATTVGGSFTPEALNQLAAETGGYPFFIQEYGSTLWNLAPRTPFTIDDVHAAIIESKETLDMGFYPARWDRATPKERTYLRALAKIIAHTNTLAINTGIVAAEMNTSLQRASPYRASLIAKGIIYQPEYGKIAFTVTGMAEFVNRQYTNTD